MKLLTFAVYMALFAVSSCIADFPQLSALRSKASSETQGQAVHGLLKRLIGERVSDFDIEIDSTLGPQDTFKLSSVENGRIKITATGGVAAAMGFYHYLKYFCYGQITWAGKQTMLPPVLPPLKTAVTISTLDKFRYYQNVCTLSYSSAFWSWERWEKEIDWMALHGFNLPLAFVGQEAIFQRMYLSMGFTQKELDEHFGGPAFLAWARMGNIRGWGGPLPQMWITQKLMLQHKILGRMRELGMVPVLPAFAGHVPAAIKRVFPKANVTRLGNWGHFNSTFSGTYLLDFEDPLFQTFGKTFIQMQTQEFGSDHIYNADTFNEMRPASSDPDYIAKAGKSVFKAMTAGDPQAVWLMQGWMFLSPFWQAPQVKALVTSVPKGSMIILDLAAEIEPVYQKFESFYGQPFIWCMLHNFGGTMEFYGVIDNINKGPSVARNFPKSTMIGVGVTPEGIHQNEVIYEFMAENSWRKEPRDVYTWLSNFTQQRYGQLNDDVNNAWQLLLGSVYNATDAHRDHDLVMITKRPDPKYDVTSDVWYNPEDVFRAWDGFVNASHALQGSSLFHYDIADVSRNNLQLVALIYFSEMVKAYKAKDIPTIEKNSASIVELLSDLNDLLCSNERFLLGLWIADAHFWATSTSEKTLLEYNARNQITLWGPNGEIHDYASKQWCGVVKDFYKPRWEFFSNWLIQLIKNGTSWDSYIFREEIMRTVESPWTFSTYPQRTEPSGNPIVKSTELHAKYRPVTKNEFFRKIWKDIQIGKKSKKGLGLYVAKISRMFSL
ncbi:N-acetylglucosaminidase, alpha [Plakobranchus ocellatus]|uniref:Alpha-N-acetylglucosaminidase n=1 Tax=Plakobranchus ocellatus TaxID=259542 RepID=A0AAV3ZHT4_9GAST|nr:N-acetylglucosaminidase, alpha [Plakobranchus ocellatus]